MSRPGLSREQRAWCVYDWANSVFKISVLTVFFSLYLTEVATADSRAAGHACPTALRDCPVSLLGLDVQAGSLFGFLLAGSTLLQVVVLPITGAIADRTTRRRRLLGGFALAGAAATAGLAVVSGTGWRLGAVLFAVANLCYYASVVVYSGWLPEIAEPDRRTSVSSTAWSLGYLGGGICLASNIAVVSGRELLGWSQGEAVRACFVVCGLWWAAFTLLSLGGLPERPPAPDRTDRDGATPDRAGPETADRHRVTAGGAGFRPLLRTLAELRRFPVTLAFLAVFLIYIDGVNTANATAGLYATEQLGIPLDTLTLTVLGVQFIAFAGGVLHGLVAARIGARATLVGSLALWVAVIVAVYAVHPGDLVGFWVAAAGLGLALAGPAALSRSLFSQLIPPGRAGEYFALYTLGERGTSSLGPLVFSVVATATGSFRPAILSLIGFLVVGCVGVALVPVRAGIRAAGNPEPRLV